MDDFTGVLNASVGQLRNVDQTFGERAIFQLGESAELRDFGDRGMHQLPGAVVHGDFIPGVQFLAFDAQSDAVFFAVDADDFYAHFLAGAKRIPRMPDVSPAQLAVVHQTFGTAQIDEHAKIRQADDGTGADIAHFQFGDQLFLALFSLLS